MLDHPYLQTQPKTIELLRRAFQFKFRANELDRLYNNLRHLAESLHKTDELALRHHFTSDIWLMIQMQAEKMTQSEAEDRLIIEAKALIDRHAFREVRLQDIADRLHIHPVQFSRRFQRTFGLSPSHYLHSIRMERARNLLTSTEYTIDHIARLCGYENGFYFSRVFTRYCGLNPSRYRKLHSPNSL
jgi:AraC-like DNA-binding protein